MNTELILLIHIGVVLTVLTLTVIVNAIGFWVLWKNWKRG